MRKIIAILSFMNGSMTFAGINVLCHDPLTSSSFVFPKGEDLLVDFGEVMHHFATATVVCKNNDEVNRRIIAREPFTCGGLWHHDFEPSGHRELDTPVKIELAPTEHAYEARFVTSKSYGSMAIRMDCEIL